MLLTNGAFNGCCHSRTSLIIWTLSSITFYVGMGVVYLATHDWKYFPSFKNGVTLGSYVVTNAINLFVFFAVICKNHRLLSVSVYLVLGSIANIVVAFFMCAPYMLSNDVWYCLNNLRGLAVSYFLAFAIQMHIRKHLSSWLRKIKSDIQELRRLNVGYAN